MTAAQSSPPPFIPLLKDCCCCPQNQVRLLSWILSNNSVVIETSESKVDSEYDEVEDIVEIIK